MFPLLDDDLQRRIDAVRARRPKLDKRRSQYAHQGDRRFTKRRMEVLTLIAAGYTNKEIAVTLKISLESAKAHVRMLISMLHASNRAHAVSIAYEVSLLELGATAL